MPTLWIRADGSPRLGLGHVMRTVALAEIAITRGLQVRFVVGGEGAVDLPLRHGFPADPVCEGWEHEVSQEDVVVFDGYHFTNSDHERVEHARCVAAVDDLGHGSFAVDVLVNPTLSEKQTPRYELSRLAKTLFGPRHALIRQEFVARRRFRNGSGERVLVTTGGADSRQVGTRIATALAGVLQVPCRPVLLAGPAARVLDLPRSVEIVSDPPTVAAVFDTADIVVSAGGNTTWELLAMGLPTVLVEIADNQTAVIDRVVGLGAAVYGGTAADVGAMVATVVAEVERMRAPAVRRDLSARALDVVDGQGAGRVVGALLA